MTRRTGIQLDPDRSDPLYRQLFDEVARRIRTGTWRPGFRLPPTRILAGELRTHRNTVVRAYEDLSEAGFVHSTVGRGTFVAEPPRELELLAGASTGDLPWTSLAANAVRAEPLGRSERLSAAEGGQLINLYRMQ